MKTTWPSVRLSLAVGALAGAAAFAALSAFGSNPTFTIAEVAADPGKFYGKQVEITGIARSVRQTTFFSSSLKARIPVISFMLYEPGAGKGQTIGRHYLSVTLPADQFRFLPNENAPLTVTGQVRAPSQVGIIEP